MSSTTAARLVWGLLVASSFVYASGNTCALCDAGTFCANELLSNCPAHSSSDPGSGSIAECICDAAYYRDGNTCRQCGPDAYCTGNELRSSCPPTTQTLSNYTTSILGCVCRPGHYGAAGAICSQCAAGKYQNLANQASCEQCPINTYVSTKGSILATDCLGCPSNTVSDAGSTQLSACVSAPGYFTDPDGNVLPCPEGTFQDERGKTSCKNCIDDLSLHNVDGSVTVWSDATAATSSSVCQQCPPNSQIDGDEGGDSITDCQCNAGYVGANGDTCAACLPGTYKPSLGSNAAIPCPIGTYSDTGGQTVCESCPAVTTTTLSLGADDLGDCECVAGYHGDGGEACTQCAAGFFCAGNLAAQAPCPVDTYSAVGASSCTPCHANSSAPAESTSVAACECDSGYYTELLASTGEICNVCGVHPSFGAGYFSTSPTGCEPCAKGSYLLSSEIAEPNTICHTCPLHSTTLLTATSADTVRGACVCEPGYVATPEGEAFACTPCDAGSAKAGISNTAVCETCDVNTYAGAAAAECAECPENALSDAGSGSIAACQCREGYAISGTDDCQACSAGHYKDTVSDTLCEPCAAGTYQISTAATACDVCLEDTFTASSGTVTCTSCQDYSTRSQPDTPTAQDADEASDCQCNAGHYLADDATCTQCPLGTFKTGSGNEACTSCDPGYTTEAPGAISSISCLQCAADKYTVVVNGAQTCKACPEDSSSAVGSDAVGDCECNPGFTEISGTPEHSCQACELGTYKTSVGSDACTDCPAGYVGTPDIAVRVLLAESCSQCESGTYTDGQTCAECPANTESAAGSSNINACLCSVGYEGLLGQACTACIAGEFKNHTGPGDCRPCQANTYSATEAASACQACRANSESLTGSNSPDACLCKAGYELRDGTCHQCSSGTYSTSGGGGCQQCSVNHYYPEMTPLYDADRCLSCPLNAEAAAGSYRLSSCMCKAGFVHTVDGSSFSCEICEPGSYCPEQTDGNGERTLLTASLTCPSNSWSTEGAKSLSDCYCVAGFYGTDGVCALCDPGNFCPTGATVMSECRAHSTTLGLAGRNSSDACVCNGGYYLDEASQECEVCPLDSYCYQNEQISCPEYSLPDAQASSVTDCKCETGRYMDTDPGTGELACLACPPNILCVGGAATPTNCAANAEVVGLSCVCPLGSYCVGEQNTSCVEPSVCQICDANTYCAHNALHECPEHATSPRSSSSFNNCTCNDGYYMDHGKCHVCPLNSYCAGNLENACQAWDPNLVTAGLEQNEFEDCRCRAGYFRLSTMDLCKPCPLDFYCPDAEELAFPSVVQCLPNEYTYDQGSTSRQQCICDTGHKLDATGAVTICLPCGQGERCQAGEVLEYQCHFQLRTANEDHSKCVCMAGYQQNTALECEPCFPGTIKPDAGDHQCVPCSANEFSFNATMCKACPEHTISPAGSAECTCAAPYVPGSDLYPPFCGLCGVDHYYVAGASQYIEGVCEPCMHNSSTEGRSGQVGRGSCICDNGFVRTAQHTCAACPANFYEEDGVCEPCGHGASSPPASTSQSACVCNATLCNLKMPWYDCANSCPDDVEPCEQCPPGFFRSGHSDVGNTDLCQPCALDRFQEDAGQAACDFCPSTRQTLLPGSTSASNCTCRPGFEPGADPSPLANCSACAPGYFKADPGDVECLACPVGTFMPSHGATACLRCDAPPDSTPLTFATTGQGPGPKLLMDKDVVLTVGQQVTVNWAATAPSHPFGLTTASRHPFVAPPNDVVTQIIDYVGETTTITVHSTDIQLYYMCSYGHGFIGVPVVILPASAYGGHTPGANTTTAVASTTASDCVCTPGHFRGDSDTCEACIVGSFKALPGMQACDFCGSNVTSYDLHLIHHYGSGSPGATDVSHCVSCPGDGHSAGRPYTDVSYDSPMNEPEDCLCFPGYDTFSVASGCEACTNFTRRSTYSHDDCEFCPPKHYFFAANEPCVLCQLTDHDLSEPVHSEVANSHYPSLPWATSEADCTCRIGAERVALSCRACDKGTFRDSLLQPECVACPKNQYQDETRNTECKACPANSFTLTNGSTALTDCLCEAGFEWDGDKCVACQPGNFKALADSDPADRNNLAYQCQACPDGTYTDETGATACKACGVNEKSDLPRDRQGTCMCRPGFGGLPCTSCVHGTYNPGNVLADTHKECTACPTNKNTSTVGNTGPEACVCVPGTGTSDEAALAECTLCADGYYSLGGINHPCLHCGFGTISEPPLGASSFEHCQCNHDLGLYEAE